MGDPVPDLDVAVDAVADGLDAVLAEPGPEHEAWLVKPSEPRWQVWRDRNGRRPPSRAEKRGRVAAALAGTIFAVLAFGGLISYAIQWQGVHRDALDALAYVEPPSVYLDAEIPTTVENASKRVGATDGLIGIANGKVVAWTPVTGAPATDKGFIRTVERRSTEPATGEPESYWSPSSSCEYKVFSDGAIAWVMVMDTTPARDRMDAGYLVYGLVGLGIAGASGGTVYWRLGRKRNTIGEPDEV
jgi:hypothetical protein